MGSVWTFKQNIDPESDDTVTLTRDDDSTEILSVGEAVELSDTEFQDLVRQAVLVPGGIPLEKRSLPQQGILVINEDYGAVVQLVDL